MFLNLDQFVKISTLWDRFEKSIYRVKKIDLFKDWFRLPITSVHIHSNEHAAACTDATTAKSTLGRYTDAIQVRDWDLEVFRTHTKDQAHLGINRMAAKTAVDVGIMKNMTVVTKHVVSSNEGEQMRHARRDKNNEKQHRCQSC